MYHCHSTYVVRPKGFEPPISGIGIRCVIQLRHGRMLHVFSVQVILYHIIFETSQSDNSSQISYQCSCSDCSSSMRLLSSISFS